VPPPPYARITGYADTAGVNLALPGAIDLHPGGRLALREGGKRRLLGASARQGSAGSRPASIRSTRIWDGHQSGQANSASLAVLRFRAAGPISGRALPRGTQSG